MVLQNLLIDNSYLVEVNIGSGAPAAGQRISFLDVPTLRNVKVYGIQCLSETNLSKSPNNKTVVAANGCAGAVVTFAIQQSEKVYQYPLYDLISSVNGGLIRWFNGLNINLPKSYITILDPTNISASESFMFNFDFRK
jgi:hypothetical protein